MKNFYEGIRVLMEESISLHCRSDVQIGSYLSGGIDSSLIYKMSLENLRYHGLLSTEDTLIMKVLMKVNMLKQQ